MVCPDRAWSGTSCNLSCIAIAIHAPAAVRSIRSLRASRTSRVPPGSAIAATVLIDARTVLLSAVAGTRIVCALLCGNQKGRNEEGEVPLHLVPSPIRDDLPTRQEAARMTTPDQHFSALEDK